MNFSRILSSLSIMTLAALASSAAHAADSSETCNDALSMALTKEAAAVRKKIYEIKPAYASYPVEYRVQFDLLEAYSRILKTAGQKNSEARLKNFESFFPSEQILAIAQDRSQKVFQIRLNQIFQEILKTGPGFSDSYLKTILTNKLKELVPESTIAARIEDWAQASSSKRKDKAAPFKRLLGDMSLNEVQLLTYGFDATAPSAESLIGQYITQTGAKSKLVRFAKGPKSNETGRTVLGETKLVVAISRESLATYQKLFTRAEVLIDYHTARQGTLNLLFEGKVGSYLNFGQTLANSFRTGTIMPHVLLATSEGQRMSLAVELGTTDRGNYYSYREPKHLGFCHPGGYDSCTYWVGDLPLGDTVVDLYKRPGKVDAHADNQVLFRPFKSPQIAPIKAYDPVEAIQYSKSQGRINYGRTDNYLPELLSTVWPNKGEGAPMQFSEMLGKAELQANLDGEYANPGWVAHRLTGHVKKERVPVVFWMTDNHQVEIPENFDAQINAY